MSMTRENIKLQHVSEIIFERCQSYENRTRNKSVGVNHMKIAQRNKLIKMLYHKFIKKVTRNTKIWFL